MQVIIWKVGTSEKWYYKVTFVKISGRIRKLCGFNAKHVTKAACKLYVKVKLSCPYPSASFKPLTKALLSLLPLFNDRLNSTMFVRPDQFVYQKSVTDRINAAQSPIYGVSYKPPTWQTSKNKTNGITIPMFKFLN